MRNVSSSNIKAIGYDPDHQVLEIEFRNGGRYRYHGVPPAEHERLLNDPLDGSHGKHLHQFIKGRYQHQKL